MANLKQLLSQPSANEEVFTVGQLTRSIKGVLESKYGGVWVKGEISNFRQQESGHCYFSLKDAQSQIPAVLFRADAAQCRVQLKDGMEIVGFGNLSVYEPRGYYQLILRTITQDGAGKLQAEFERLKKKLQEEGLFEGSQKKALPAVPRVIGIVTSPTGAALQDFISVLKRRGWKGRLILFPARVQGKEAAGEIVKMIGHAQKIKELELLVVGRGGGSLEDLWPFNEEAVVRAVAACKVPTISAVGHEIDFTLCDFTADKRAETPTAAAELISSLYLEAVGRVETAANTLIRQTTYAMMEARHRVAILEERLAARSPRRQVEEMAQRLDELRERAQAAVTQRISEEKMALERLGHRMERASPERRVELARLRLKGLGERLEAASPRSILNRGFAMVRGEKGSLVTSAAMARKGPVDLIFGDGELKGRIE